MEFKTLDELNAALKPCAQATATGLQVKDWAAFRNGVIDRIAFNAAFAADAGVRDASRWLCRAAGEAPGAFAAALHEL